MHIFLDSSDGECSNDAGRISDDNIDDGKNDEKNEHTQKITDDKKSNNLEKNIKEATLNQTLLKKRKVKRKKIVKTISQQLISGTALGSITPIQSNNSNGRIFYDFALLF